MEDTQIVELFFSRSEEAISETSRKYGSYLRTIAHNVLPDSQDVEEVVNDVYLAAWNSIPPKCPPVLNTICPGLPGISASKGSST